VLRTASRSRHYLGLKRFGPIVESDVDADELNATGIGRWSPITTLIASPFTDGSGITWKPVVNSRVLTDLEPNPAMIDGEEITTVDLNKTLGFARHRREPTSR